MIVLVHSAADVDWSRRLQGFLQSEVKAVEVESRLETLPPLLAKARPVVLLMSPELVARGRELAAVLRDAPGRIRVVALSVKACERWRGALAPYRPVLRHWYPLTKMDGNEATLALATAADRILSILGRGAVQMMRSDAHRPAPSPARERRQPVRLGASAPRIVKPGQEFTARFAAYHPRLARVMKRHLRKAGTRAIPHRDLWSGSWKRGTIVTVELSGDGLEVSSARQDFVWEGAQHTVDFDLRAQSRSKRYDTRLKFDVSIEGVMLARIRLDLAVAQPRRRDAWSGRLRCAHAISPKKAFASYAEEDMARVLERVAGIRIAAGIDVFMDCLSLRAGQRWQVRLATEIAGREIFMLFWSKFAARSRWVKWEWRHALETKGLDAIQPHPLDPWPKAPLPRELSSLHMGDPLMAVRESALREESRDRTSAPGASPPPARA